MIGLSISAIPEPSEYILSFPTQDNPLNISVISPVEKNYIMVIGDWASQLGDRTDLALQAVIAQKMLSYYNESKANGYNLLMVITTGDNFYYRGQNCSTYDIQWKDIYGEIATKPWLAVMGNHDWGAMEPTALCAWGSPNPFILQSTGIIDIRQKPILKTLIFLHTKFRNGICGKSTKCR